MSMSSPYADETPPIPGRLFTGTLILHKKKRMTERGELLKVFAQKTDKPIGYIAMRLKNFQLLDLYFIDANCRAAEQRNIPYGAIFWSSIKVK